MSTVLEELDDPGLPAGQALTLAAMYDIAGGFVEVPDIDRLLPLPALPGSRRQVLLVATPTFEAWLVEWPAGSELPVHDHGGSLAVLRVRTGALTERRSGSAVEWRRLEPGASTTLPAGTGHTVWNTGRAAAMSVHVYSPPLVGSAAAPRGAG